MRQSGKIPVLTLKIVSLIAVASIVLSTVLFFVGFTQFEKQFDRQYKSHILSIAHTAREFLNADLFEEYLKTNKPDGSWYAVHDVLQKMVNKFDLDLMYVSCVEPPEFTKIHYIYNPVRPAGRFKEYPLGYTENYVQKKYNESAHRIFEKGEELVRHTPDAKSGPHITANIPVRNSIGAVVAMLGVRLSTQEFVDVRQSYIRWTILTEGFFLLLYIIFFAYYYRKQFIHPILAITQEAQRFASDSSRISDITCIVKNRDEIGTLAQSVHKMEEDIQNYITNLTKVTSEKERMNTELNIATGIQAGLLPKEFIDRDNVSIRASMTPAKEVGGDFYDFAMLDDHHALAIVADVSGKGVPAALFMAMGTTLLRDHIALMLRSSTSLVDEVGLVNNILCRNNEGGLFITAWIGILNTQTGRLAYIDAGHNPPLVKQNDADFAFIPKAKKGLPLASMEDFPYKLNEIFLKPGDRLLLYTDGVTEAQNKEQKLFGEDQLLEYAVSHQAEMQAQFMEGLIKALADFQSGCDQFDDITMLMMDYKAAAGCSEDK